MAITTSKKPTKEKWSIIARHFFSSIPALILVFSTDSSAADWKIAPSVNYSESYSDNIRLLSQDAKQSDAISELSPEISILGSGPRLHFNFDYRMQNLAYRTATSEVKTYNHLNTSGNLSVIDNFLFLDGRAAIQQQNISPFGPQPTNNLNLDDNRTEIKTASFSPYLRHNFGNTAATELRYTRDSVDSSAGGLASSQSNRFLFNLNSGPAFNTWGWGLQYNEQKINYFGLKSVETEASTVNLHYKITPEFSVNSSTGYERQNYLSIAEKPAGYFWTAGFSWMPSTRTSISSSAGKRFYGNSLSLDATHRAASSMWSLTYKEDVTSSQSQFLLPATIDTAEYLNNLWLARLPDPETRQEFVDAFIQDASLPAALSQNVNTLTNRFFLQKNLQGSVALSGARNTLIFSLYNTEREAKSVSAADNVFLGSGNLALNDKTRQTGVNAVWNWRMSTRTSALLDSGYARITSVAVGQVDTNRTLKASLTRQLQPKLKGSIELRRLQNTSNKKAGEIRENAITASLIERF